MCEYFRLAVCGAHLSGMSLNYQLTELGSKLETPVLTTAAYRFFALANQEVPKPGLFRSANGGAPIQMEIWQIPLDNTGRFIMRVPWPLSIGKIETSNGDWVHGFLCDPYEAQKGTEITHLGSWKEYIKS